MTTKNVADFSCQCLRLTTIQGLWEDCPVGDLTHTGKRCTSAMEGLHCILFQMCDAAGTDGVLYSSFYHIVGELRGVGIHET